MNVLPSEKPKISGLNSTICKCMEITVTSQNDATKDKHGAQLGEKFTLKITVWKFHTVSYFHEFPLISEIFREIKFQIFLQLLLQTMGLYKAIFFRERP